MRNKTRKIFLILEKIILIVAALIAATAALFALPEFKNYLNFNKKEFPKGLDILIFNASSSKGSHYLLKQLILESDPNAKIDAQYRWRNRWVMSKTRIYFVGEKNKKAAESIAAWMPKEQDIVDYNSQLQAPIIYPENPNYRSRMVDIDPKRDILIFLGDDYHNILGIINKG